MPTLQMLISALFKLVFPFSPDASGERKKAVAQAFTSWNEHLTYKGVPLHISATGGSETKIHQGARRHCHWLTRGAAIKWERPSLVWVCQRVFLRLCWELKLVKRMIFKITKEYSLQLVVTASLFSPSCLYLFIFCSSKASYLISSQSSELCGSWGLSCLITQS